jgi:hypothetical protein
MTHRAVRLLLTGSYHRFRSAISMITPPRSRSFGGRRRCKAIPRTTSPALGATHHPKGLIVPRPQWRAVRCGGFQTRALHGAVCRQLRIVLKLPTLEVLTMAPSLANNRGRGLRREHAAAPRATAMRSHRTFTLRATSYAQCHIGMRTPRRHRCKTRQPGGPRSRDDRTSP